MPAKFHFHAFRPSLPAGATNFCRPARNILDANGNQSFP